MPVPVVNIFSEGDARCLTRQLALSVLSLFHAGAGNCVSCVLTNILKQNMKLLAHMPQSYVKYYIDVYHAISSFKHFCYLSCHSRLNTFYHLIQISSL